MIDKKDFNRTTGQLLARLRTGNNITQAELAKRMGITEDYVYRVEAGNVSISIYWLYKACVAMGLHMYINTLVEDGFAPRSEEVSSVLNQLHHQKRASGQN